MYNENWNYITKTLHGQLIQKELPFNETIIKINNWRIIYQFTSGTLLSGIVITVPFGNKIDVDFEFRSKNFIERIFTKTKNNFFNDNFIMNYSDEKIKKNIETNNIFIKYLRKNISNRLIIKILHGKNISKLKFFKENDVKNDDELIELFRTIIEISNQIVLSSPSIVPADCHGKPKKEKDSPLTKKGKT